MKKCLYIILFLVSNQSFIIAHISHTPTKASLRNGPIALNQILPRKDDRQEKISMQKKYCKNNRRRTIEKVVGWSLSFGAAAVFGTEMSYETGRDVALGLTATSGARLALGKFSKTDGIIFAHCLAAMAWPIYCRLQNIRNMNNPNYDSY